jgi:homoserine kinase type II
VAVYTDVSDADLATLLGQYNLGPALALKGIAEGVENSNFFLETQAGRFILTIFERRVRAEDLPFFMAVKAHLADRGIPCPAPQPTKTGALTAVVAGKPCAIVSFLTGVSPKRPTAGQCQAIGEMLGRMHLALADFPGRRANTLGPLAWRGLISPRMEAAENLGPGLARAIGEDLDRLEQTWPQDLTQGVIHADLFPDNALLLGDQVGGVIDFYFACTDALAYDLAVCLNAWCFEPDRSFNLTKSRALLSGYQRVRPLSAAEQAALPTLAAGAAMRFFATRIADWAATPPGALVRPKDPMDYAHRLAFHRQVRGSGDYGLF